MNSKTGFLTISRKDCHNTACEIVKNAETHLSIAEDLEKSNHYGFAMSHYITALEELTKALVLNLDGAGFRFRSVKEFGALFSNHEFRYFLSFFIFFMSIFDDDLTQLCTYLNTNQVKLEKILKDVSIDNSNSGPRCLANAKSNFLLVIGFFLVRFEGLFLGPLGFFSFLILCID